MKPALPPQLSNYSELAKQYAEYNKRIQKEKEDRIKKSNKIMASYLKTKDNS